MSHFELPPTHLFGKARLAVLAALFVEGWPAKHLRQIAREGSVAPTAVGRELELFLAEGMLVESRVGNMRFFRADPGHPLVPPLQALVHALMASHAMPARDEQVHAMPSRKTSTRSPRKSVQLGLSAPYDWPSAEIGDDALIAKAGASLRYEDMVRLCAHFGVDRVRRVLRERVTGELAQAVLERQLRHIETAQASLAAMERRDAA